MIRNKYTGNISHYKILLTPLGKFRGFCFISYDDILVAEKVMEKKCHFINEEPIQIKWAFSKDQCQKKLIDEKFKKVYLSKLSSNVTPEILKGHFGKFGAIVDIRVIMDKQTQKNKGFGFILFRDRDSLSKALVAGKIQILKALNEEVIFFF